MYRQIKAHLQYLEKELDLEERASWLDLYEYHLAQLKIFNMERLIHLFIMLFTGLYTVVLFGFALGLNNYLLLAVAFICLILFVCYLIYYFKLENVVQKLVGLSSRFLEKIESEAMEEEVTPAQFELSPAMNVVVDKVLDLVAKIIKR